ncbi:hypothetical protein M8J77_008837 [Diaphorina citri]|nr:hypothetical protein M8J77_008837 [Diaphorina citri]
MLFYSFFKSLVGKDVVVELKNDVSICGTLHSVDQYLNIKLTDISVTDPDKYPHMLSVKNCFIRGSVVRYVQLPDKFLSSGAVLSRFILLLYKVSSKEEVFHFILLPLALRVQFKPPHPVKRFQPNFQ